MAAAESAFAQCRVIAGTETMRRRPTVVILSLAALALAACASSEELRQADARACQGYGFAPGTPAFASCMQREALARSRPGSAVSLGVGGGFFGGRGGFGGAGVGLGF